jgi:hypothetical protein
MSDILGALLTAYKEDIERRMEAGGELSYLNACFLADPGAISQDWSTPVPFCLIFPTGESLAPHAIGPARSDLRLYQITISLFQEFEDETLGIVGKPSVGIKGIIDMKEDFDALYARQTFALSMSCLLMGINYNRLNAPQVRNLFQINLTFQHTWIDTR